jgi:hypothetical protein
MLCFLLAAGKQRVRGGIAQSFDMQVLWNPVPVRVSDRMRLSTTAPGELRPKTELTRLSVMNVARVLAEFRKS